MTDFDTRILDEERSEPLPAPAVADEQDERRTVLPPELLRPAGEPVRHPAGRRAPEAVRKPPADRRAPEAVRKPPADRRAPEPVNEPPATIERDVQQRAVERRERLLVAALATLARTPENLRPEGLFAAYEQAPAAEVARAAGGFVTCYLRAGTAVRRRMRPVLAEALRRAGRAPLALAIAAHLGAIAMPPARPAAPPAPPAPTAPPAPRALSP